MLRVLAVGNWDSARVTVRTVPASRRIVGEVEAMIDAAWAEAVGRPGVKLFDGPMVRMEGWRVVGEQLALELSRTSYKPFLGTNLSHPELIDRFGADVMANPVGVSPALETADGFLLLGRRNESVAYYPSRVHPFAGALEPRDESDLFAAVRRELREELSLEPADVPEVHCTGIVEDLRLRQPELIFHARTVRKRAEVEARIDPEEHGGSVAIPANAEAVEGALCHPALTPVAAAALLLFGRVRFGPDWFARAGEGFA